METYYFSNAYSLLIGNLQNGKSTDFVNIPGPTDTEDAKKMEVATEVQMTDTTSEQSRQRPTTMPRQPQQRSVSSTVSTSGGSY